MHAPVADQLYRSELLRGASIGPSHGTSLDGGRSRSARDGADSAAGSNGAGSARSAAAVSCSMVATSSSALPRSPYHHSAIIMFIRYGTRSWDRSSIHRVPLVAILLT